MEIKDVIVPIVATGISFGAGCAAGALLGAPVLVTGGIFAVSTLANHIFSKVNDYAAEKLDWNLSTHTLTRYLGPALIASAVVVAFFALGVFGGIPLAILLASISLGAIYGAVKFAVMRYQEEDMPYREFLRLQKEIVERLAEDAQLSTQSTPKTIPQTLSIEDLQEESREPVPLNHIRNQGLIIEEASSSEEEAV